MKTENVNSKLRNAIKLRHLVDGMTENWQQLSQVKSRVLATIEEATQFIETYGTDKAKNEYHIQLLAIKSQIEKFDKNLNQLHLVLIGESSDLVSINWNDIQTLTASIEGIFSTIEHFDEGYFCDCNYNDWKEIWTVIKSNLYTIKGISNSAFVKIKMIENFNHEEIDILTKNILKNIPKNFSLSDADKYEKEYLAAMQAIENEANKKEYLWDKFLNILAGAIPFKQSPEERVMMQRWLDGEKGNL